MDPVAILAWANLVLEVGAMFERLMTVGRRMQAGEDISPAELERLKAATDAAVARWNAAAPADRPNKPATPSPEP